MPLSMSRPSNVLRYLSRRLTHTRSHLCCQPELQSSEQGLSLLECLMAVAVIGLTAAMITPPLYLAAATRVQNRRAEQAFQLAQGEIDRIQVIVAKGQHVAVNLPQAAGGTLALVPPPSGASSQLDSVNATCNTYNDQPLPITTALRIDVDGDCSTDFLMQTFRSTGVTSSTDPQRRLTDFEVGVRVYAFLAQGNWANLQRDQASLVLTTGLGSQRTRPLSVLFNRMTWSEQSATLCRYNPGVGCAP